MERRLSNPEQTFRGLFLALGYRVHGRGSHGFEAEGSDGLFHVWVPALGKSADLDRIRTDILQELDAGAAGGARRLVLLPTLPALGAAFQTAVKDRGALLRTYGQFLDDEFKTDDSLVVSGAAGAETRRRARAVLDARGEKAREGAAMLPPTLRARLDARDGFDPARARGLGRLPQPYTKVAGPPLGSGADLLTDVIAALDPEEGAGPGPAKGAHVILVIGNAGVGKSVFFDALYAYANRRFIDVKRRQGVAARAIRFTPDEIVDAPSFSADRLFEAIAETPEAGLGRREVLDWRLHEGLALLMFDGLDEFFADQDDFFAEIEARYLGEASRARLLICLRDSLLVTSDAVRALIERLSAHSASERSTLSILRVEPWLVGDAEARAFAWARIEGREPEAGEADTPRVRAFAELLGRIEGDEAWREVAGLPFFLQAMAEMLAEGETADLADPAALLDQLVARITLREWRKLDAASENLTQAEAAFARSPDVLRRLRLSVPLAFKGAAWVRMLETIFGAAPATPDQVEAADKLFDSLSVFEGRADFQRLLEDLAHLKRRGGQGAALTRETLLDIYARSLPFDRTRAARRRGEIVLRQFALFEADGGDAVDFNHVLIADHLAGRAAARRILDDASPAGVRKALGAAPADETPAFARALERGLADAPEALKAWRAA